MKLALSFTFLFVGLSISSAVAEDRPPIDDSSCNQNLDRDSCLRAVDDTTKAPCSWCIAGAIPSECMSQEQAAILPSGVFDCSIPGTVHSGKKSYKLRLQLDNRNEPDISDICDSKSKSISGYMDIKGSEYDEAGENKHLFFWMFEKRGAYNQSADEVTPVSTNICAYS